MANTVAFSRITNEEINFFGSQRRRFVTLTLVSDGTAYADGGIADATNFGVNFALKLDFKKIKRVIPVTALRTSDFELAFARFEVDLTNRKLVLYREGGVSITGTTIAVASATSITDSANGLLTAGFRAGDLISCDGFTGTAGNNGQVARVTVAAAGALTLAASGLTADAAGETVTITKVNGQTISEMNAVAIPAGTYTAVVEVIGT